MYLLLLASVFYFLMNAFPGVVYSIGGFTMLFIALSAILAIFSGLSDWRSDMKTGKPIFDFAAIFVILLIAANYIAAA